MPETETSVPQTEPAPKPLPRIFIATPAYGSMTHMCYWQSLHKVITAAEKQGVHTVLWQQGGESHINRARNRAVAEFMGTDCTHLFFIDADIIFDVPDFAKVISAAMSHDLDVVAGAYPIKEIRWDSALAALQAGRDPHREASRIVVHRVDIEQNTLGYVEGVGDCMEVKECGTGFMCISRKAIEAVIAAHPEIEYDDDRHPSSTPVLWNIFHSDIKPDIFMGKPSRRWLSEDYWFCRTWREMGGKVWLHLGVDLGHFGQYEHRGNPHEVHGGPKQGAMVPPERRDQAMAIFQGSMLPPESPAPPRMIVDHEAKEGTFALWAAHQYPDAVFDLYEPNPQYREMLRTNFAMYGLRGQVHDTKPTCNFALPYWEVIDGKVEIRT